MELAVSSSSASPSPPCLGFVSNDYFKLSASAAVIVWPALASSVVIGDGLLLLEFASISRKLAFLSSSEPFALAVKLSASSPSISSVLAKLMFS